MQMFLVTAGGRRRVNNKTTFKYMSHLVATDGGESAAEARIHGMYIGEFPDYTIAFTTVLDVTKDVRNFVDDNPRVH